MRKTILFTLWTAAVAVAASFFTIAVSPLLARVSPFDRLLYFQSFQTARSIPVEYHYTTYMGKIPVRINVATGDAELLSMGGWVAMKPSAPRPAATTFQPPPQDMVAPRP
jgi:hypothetical protein